MWDLRVSSDSSYKIMISTGQLFESNRIRVNVKTDSIHLDTSDILFLPINQLKYIAILVKMLLHEKHIALPVCMVIIIYNYTNIF